MEDMTKIQAARAAEYATDKTAAVDSFAAYWAGSASASVMRDYRAGRVRDTKIKPPRSLRIVRQS